VPLLTTRIATKEGHAQLGNKSRAGHGALKHTRSTSWDWEREGTRKEQHTTGKHLKQEMGEDDGGSPR
jgi:hypothetical protein